MRFIRRLIFTVMLAIILLAVGLYFLVDHARQAVVKAAQSKVPSVLNVKPAASFSSISFDADSFATVEFKLGYTSGDSAEVKDVSGTPYAAWKAKPWDEVSFQLGK